MNILLRLCVIALTTMVFVGASVAHAHSPCYDAQGRENGCISIHSGPIGTEVQTRDVPVLRVVFNLYDGRPEGGPRPSIYHPELPSYVLREFVQPKETTSFMIPDVPPGTYNIGIFDGSERGKHFTSAPFRVVEAAVQAGVPVDPVEDDHEIWPPLALAATAAFAVGVGIGVLLARRRWRHRMLRRPES